MTNRKDATTLELLSSINSKISSLLLLAYFVASEFYEGANTDKFALGFYITMAIGLSMAAFYLIGLAVSKGNRR